MSDYTFDELVYKLGKPCRKFGHLWKDTQQCLRYTRNNGCVECARLKGIEQKQEPGYHEKQREYSKRPEVKERAKRRLQRADVKLKIQEYRQRPEFKARQRAARQTPEAKVKRKAYNQTEKTKASKKAYAERNCEKILESRRQYRQSEKGKENWRKYYQANKETIKARVKEWAKNNPERLKARMKAWSKTENGKTSEVNHRRKRRLAKCKNHTIRFKPSEVKAVMSAFDSRCAYCGTSERITLDHFIPLDKGGTHTPSNVIPACLSCNSSKRNHEAYEWYSKKPFFTKKRWKKIRNYVGDAACKGQLSLF